MSIRYSIENKGETIRRKRKKKREKARASPGAWMLHSAEAKHGEALTATKAKPPSVSLLSTENKPR